MKRLCSITVACVALVSCAGWTCEITPTGINRDLATSTMWLDGEKTAWGVKATLTQTVAPQ